MSLFNITKICCPLFCHQYIFYILLLPSPKCWAITVSLKFHEENGVVKQPLNHQFLNISQKVGGQKVNHHNLITTTIIKEEHWRRLYEEKQHMKTTTTRRLNDITKTTTQDTHFPPVTSKDTK